MKLRNFEVLEWHDSQPLLMSYEIKRWLRPWVSRRVHKLKHTSDIHDVTTGEQLDFDEWKRVNALFWFWSYRGQQKDTCP